MQKIGGKVAEGKRNARVLYLDNGRYHSGVVQRSYVQNHSFPPNEAKAVRQATKRDEGHLVERVVVENPIRTCANHTRCAVSWGFGQGTAILPTDNYSVGDVVEVERRFLKP